MEIENLIEEYGDFIFRTCYLYLNDYQLAEDATQETFIKIMKFKEKFNNNSSLKTWIFRIAINNCKNIKRNSWFRFLNVSLVNLHQVPVSNFNEDFFEKRNLVDSISSLSSNDKEIIILYYYNDLSIKEISRILEKNKNTVSQRLKRARHKLKNILLEEDIYE